MEMATRKRGIWFPSRGTPRAQNCRIKVALAITQDGQGTQKSGASLQTTTAKPPEPGAFRPLRVISRNENLKIVVKTSELRCEKRVESDSPP